MTLENSPDIFLAVGEKMDYNGKKPWEDFL